MAHGRQNQASGPYESRKNQIHSRSVVTDNAHLPFALTMASIAGCQPFAAMAINDRLLALSAFASIAGGGLLPDESGSVRKILGRWAETQPILHRTRAAFESGPAAATLRELSIHIDSVRLHPPIDSPRQLFCTGANYRQHVISLMLGDKDMRGIGNENIEDPAELRRRAEAIMDQRAANAVPYVFLRSPETLIGARDSVFLPRHFLKPDWELELAAVIGRTARNVAADKAMDHVAGYTILNDMTARERVFRKDMPSMGADWLQGKNWQDSAPCGPYFVPACFVENPYALQIRLLLNERVMQDESTADMVINIERQIEFLSSVLTLHPGDIIATGSPAGNGSHHGVFMAPNDVIEGTITGLGTQKTVCV